MHWLTSLLLIFAITVQSENAVTRYNQDECSYSINKTMELFTKLSKTPSTIFTAWLPIKFELYMVSSNCKFRKNYAWLRDPGFRVDTKSLITLKCMASFRSFASQISMFTANPPQDDDEYTKSYLNFFADVDNIYITCQKSAPPKVAKAQVVNEINETILEQTQAVVEQYIDDVLIDDQVEPVEPSANYESVANTSATNTDGIGSVDEFEDLQKTVNKINLANERITDDESSWNDGQGWSLSNWFRGIFG